MIEYKNAIKADPGNGNALFELAETYILLKRVNLAVKYYQLAARAEPGTLTAHLRLGQIYLQKGQLMEARQEAIHALKISPDAIDGLHLLADLQVKEKDIESAIKTLKTASTIDDKNVKTFTGLALLYLKNRQLTKAEEAFQKAIAVDPASRDAYMGLARLYAFQGRNDKIEALLKTVLETPGITSQKHVDLAWFYEGQKNFPLAEEHYLKAIPASDEAVRPLIDLAKYYARREMKDKAVDTMQKALSKHKESVVVLTELSWIYLNFSMVDKAFETVNQALAGNPSDVDALLQKGRVLMARNDVEHALKIFDRVIGQDRLNAKAYYYRAICIETGGATDLSAQEIFRSAAGLADNPAEFEKVQVTDNLLAAAAIDPDFTDARIKLAQIYLSEKNIKKTKEQLEEIFKRRAPNLKTLTLLSGLHILEGNMAQAEKILKTIVEEKPGHIPGKLRLALLYKAMGNKEKAIAYFQAAYDLDPRQLGLIQKITNIYLEDKQYGPALALLDKVSGQFEHQTDANNALSFFENLKAEIYLNKKELDNGVIHLRKAIELQPEYITPRNLLANILAMDKDKSKALEQFRAIEKLNPDFIPALMGIGSISDLRGNTGTAQAYYRKILELDPGHARAANNLAFILSEEKDGLEEGFRLAGLARSRLPNAPDVLDTMGWLYFQKGVYPSARAEFEKSLKLNPESALTCYHYAMTLYRMKEFEEARVYFRKALKIDPDFKGASMAKNLLN